MKALHMVSMLLIWVGALNWGLFGLFNLNIVNAILGGVPIIEKIVYILVGVAGVIIIATHRNDCKICASPK